MSNPKKSDSAPAKKAEGAAEEPKVTSTGRPVVESNMKVEDHSEAPVEPEVERNPGKVKERRKVGSMVIETLE